MRYGIDSTKKTQPMRCVKQRQKRFRRLRYVMRLLFRGGDPGDYQWTWGSD